MRRTFTSLAVFLALAGMVHAHAATKDPTVKAWMANMKDIGAETKTLGLMARGQTSFDADAAAIALTRIEAMSRRIPSLFETPADDPTSEARDLIWTDWDGYRAEADALTRIAATAEVTNMDSLRQAVQTLGASCKSCHGTYRD